MVTLTEYVAVIGIPSNPLDVKASEYTFTTISFDAPAHSFRRTFDCYAVQDGA